MKTDSSPQESADHLFSVAINRQSLVRHLIQASLLVVLSYACLYFLLEAWFVGWSFLAAVLFFVPLASWFYRRGKLVASQLTLILLCNLLLIIAAIGIPFQVRSDYFFFVLFISSPLIFTDQEKVAMATGMITPVLAWAVTQWAPTQILPPSWVPHVFPSSAFVVINFLGAVGVLVLVLTQYSKHIVSIQQAAFRRLTVLHHSLQAAQLELVTSEKRFKALFENSPLGMFQLDSSLNIQHANQAITEMLGYSNDELKKLNVRQLIHAGDHAQVDENVSYWRIENMQKRRFERRYIKKNGEVIVCHISAKSVLLNDSAEPVVFAVVEEITELRRLENERKETQAKLISAAKMSTLGEMAGGIAHEINNPLAVIQGRAGLLRVQSVAGRLTPEKMQSDLATIEKTAQKIAKIIRGLKAFSRNSEGDPMEMARVSDIFQESSELCQERLQSRHIQIHLECDNDLSLECRPIQILQVLVNLIGNSIDAIQELPSRWITISAEQIDQRVQIRVTDSGHGISPALVTQIMQPFFTTKEVGKGTGLGLSISRSICEAHEGQLRYDPGSQNTRFVLDLPTRQSKARAA